VAEGNEGGSGVALKDLRHPILERVHTTTPYIPHSVSLGLLTAVEDVAAPAVAKHGILLYGVNAAGKSSLSKAIGLAVLMAQVGMPVPAAEMRLIPYTGIFTRILGNDNIWAGMSSFVVEMTEFRSILRSAGPRTLVLGDELCAGTETVSATAIVAAGIQTLVERRAQFIFATHLHELMNMSEIKELSEAGSVRPYHLTVMSGGAGGKLVYDRQLRPGSGSPMYGLEVCRGLDMDAGFLEKAMAFRKRLEGVVNVEKTSRYNAAVPVQVCNVCGSKHDLETHHIVPQAAADKKGRVGRGRGKNDVGNLVILCDTCHDKHHAGSITIRGWMDTSEGRMLDVSDA
jgi:DNA mismatch repair protein MutS